MYLRLKTVLLWTLPIVILACAVSAALIRGTSSQTPVQPRTRKLRNLSLQPEALKLSRRLGNRFASSRQTSSTLAGTLITGALQRDQIVFRNAKEDFNYETPAQPPTPDCETDVQEQLRLQSQYYRAILITPDGAEHELRPTDNYATYGGTRSYLKNYYKDIPNTVGSPMRYYSFDGSFLYAVINPSSHATSWTVYMNDGTRIVQSSNGTQRITDTNGNSIKIFSDANGTHIQDEHTAREIRLYDNKVWYDTVTGLDQSIDIVMGTTQVQGKMYQVNDWSPTGGETGGGFVCQRNELLETEVPVIREIVFPVTEPGVSAQRYSFSYNQILPPALQMIGA